MKSNVQGSDCLNTRKSYLWTQKDGGSLGRWVLSPSLGSEWQTATLWSHPSHVQPDSICCTLKRKEIVFTHAGFSCQCCAVLFCFLILKMEFIYLLKINTALTSGFVPQRTFTHIKWMYFMTYSWTLNKVMGSVSGFGSYYCSSCHKITPHTCAHPFCRHGLEWHEEATS